MTSKDDVLALMAEGFVLPDAEEVQSICFGCDEIIYEGPNDYVAFIEAVAAHVCKVN